MLHDGSNSNHAVMFDDEILEHFIENQTGVLCFFLVIMSDLIYKIFGLDKRKNAEMYGLY